MHDTPYNSEALKVIKFESLTLSQHMTPKHLPTGDLNFEYRFCHFERY